MGNLKRASNSSSKSQKFQHKESKTNNSHKARDSDDRRILMMKSLEVKRLKNAVDRQKEKMESFLPPHKQLTQKINPLYDLKGAARPAREKYQDPNQIEIKESDKLNLLDMFAGKLYEHSEGKLLLDYMYKYGVGAYTLLGHAKDAIKNFEEILHYDPSDNIKARYPLLRCYMDQADALNARKLLSNYPMDICPLFQFTRALIEHISLDLKESGASVELRNNSLMKAHLNNPYIIWIIVYHSFFEDFLLSDDRNFNASSSSILDKDSNSHRHDSLDSGQLFEAFAYSAQEFELWKDIPNAIEWLESFIFLNNLEPPTASDDSSDQIIFTNILSKAMKSE